MGCALKNHVCQLVGQPAELETAVHHDNCFSGICLHRPLLLHVFQNGQPVSRVEAVRGHFRVVTLGTGPTFGGGTCIFSSNASDDVVEKSAKI